VLDVHHDNRRANRAWHSAIPAVIPSRLPRAEILPPAFHASLDELAAQLGVTKAIVYRHFASKKDLYLQRLAAHRDELLRWLVGAWQERGSLADRIPAARRQDDVGEQHRPGERIASTSANQLSVTAASKSAGPWQFGFSRVLAVIPATGGANSIVAEPPTRVWEGLSRRSGH
jgi:AcrR family transcriptional regulator